MKRYQATRSILVFFLLFATLGFYSCSLLEKLRPPKPLPPSPSTTTTVATVSTSTGSAVSPAVAASSVATGVAVSGTAATGVAPSGAAVSSAAVSSAALPRPPVSLEQYRTGRIDPRARIQASPALAAAYRPSTQEELRQITQVLLKGENDPYSKVKLIHDWICATIAYDAAMLKSGNAVNQDIQTVLASGKAVCSGYSRVFQAMADAAGIPCVTVSGYIKNQRGTRGLRQDNSHAWNLVQILGRWYIIDTTFDAGYVKDWVFIKKYSTDNLFIDPARSIYSRFPKESWQQLLALPLSGQEFLSLPDLENDFFAYGLAFAAPAPAWETQTQGAYVLDISTGTQDIVLEGVLFGADGGEIPGAVFIQRPGRGYQRLLVSVPAKGNYSLEIYAKKPSEERIDYLIETKRFETRILAPLGSAHRTEILTHFKKISNPPAYLFTEDPFDQDQKQRVLELMRRAGYPLGPLKKVLTLKLLNQAPPQIATYPTAYARYQNSATDSLISPLSGRLKIGSELRFSYKSPDSREAALIIGDDFIPLMKNDAGIFELDLKIPATDTLCLGLSEDGKNYDIALAWEVLP